MGAAFAPVHHIKPLGLKAAALHQGLYALGQRLVLQGRKLIEPGCDPGRVNQHGQQVKAHPHRPGPQPPVRAGRRHEPQHQGQQGPANSHPQQRRLEHIVQPQPRGGFVKAKLLFNHEGAVQGKRQFQRRVNQRKGPDQCHLLHQSAAQTGIQGAVERAQTTQQGPGQRQGRAPGQCQKAKAGFGNRVIGRALVGLQGDGGIKRLRNLAAMRRYMAYLAP